MIELKNVSFSYVPKDIRNAKMHEGQPDGTNISSGENLTPRAVLKDFNLRIADGARICLFGVSGLGKTTVLRLIAGLEQPVSGSVTGTEDKKKAVVFQEDRLLSFYTVLENLTLFGPREKALEHLGALGLAECADAFPSALSGGMKRRVAIARALTADGDILILDEPFNGLDDDNAEKTAAYISTVSAGKTIIMVSHDKSDAELLGAEIVPLSFE